jgi:hypothetical protein
MGLRKITVRAEDVVKIILPDETLRDSIQVVLKIVDVIVDRTDLHKRDYLERFMDCLMGEIAERIVLQWLADNKKNCKSAVDKSALNPDAGHDILLHNPRGEEIQASIKSSISGLKSTPDEILDTFTIATKQSEIREINIQVYFWLQLYSTPRVSVPSNQNAVIIAWATHQDLTETSFTQYKGESRQAPVKKLREFRPMRDLLNEIQ